MFFFTPPANIDFKEYAKRLKEKVKAIAADLIDPINFWGRNPIPSMTKGELRNWAKRQRFSDHMPYISYKKQTGIYTCQDDEQGFIFECAPLPAEDKSTNGLLAALIDGLPATAILSFHLLSTPEIDLHLKAYRSVQPEIVRNPLSEKAVERTIEFMTKGARLGLPHTLGCVVRNVRLLCSVKIPKNSIDDCNMEDLQRVTRESLAAIFGSPPILIDPESLIRIYYELFNDDKLPENCPIYNPLKPISPAMFRADTGIFVEKDHLRIGKKHWRCITPKALGGEASVTATSRIISSGRGPEDDAKQIPSHWMLSSIVVKSRSINSGITAKAGLYNKQSKGEDGITAQTTMDYRGEHEWAFAEIERGNHFHYVYPVLLVADEDPQKSIRSTKRAESLMKAQGWAPQSETILCTTMFIASLPLGFYADKVNITNIEREFTHSSIIAACTFPVVSDFQGAGMPYLLFLTRRNQIFGLDIFDPKAENRNTVTMGGTGGGKSFICNKMVLAAYNAGAYIRISDLGYSYQRMCQMLGGFYIDLGEGNPNLNPFSFIPEEEDKESVDERANQLEAIASLVALMADSSGRAGYDEIDYNLIKAAVDFAWEFQGANAGISEVDKYLSEFPAWGSVEIDRLCKGKHEKEDDPCIIDFTSRAKKIAFNLKDWVKDGKYGTWFNGPSTVDLIKERMIVLELDKIKRTKGLFKVVSLALMNAMTATFYKLPTDIKKYALFEELGIILSESEENPLYHSILNELYRRGRKNGVSTNSVFQSPMDLANIGKLGRVITGNSAFHVYLPSEDYVHAIKTGVLNYHESALNFFDSIKSAKPRYVEVGLKTPYGVQIVRVVAEPFIYMLNTTDAVERAEIIRLSGQYEDEGMSPIDALVRALEEMANKHAAGLEIYRQN